VATHSTTDRTMDIYMHVLSVAGALTSNCDEEKPVLMMIYYTLTVCVDSNLDPGLQ